MLQKFGKDVIDDLESHEFETKKWTEEELLAIKEYYSVRIKAIERGESPTQANTGVAVLDMFKDMGNID